MECIVKWFGNGSCFVRGYGCEIQNNAIYIIVEMSWSASSVHLHFFMNYIEYIHSVEDRFGKE